MKLTKQEFDKKYEINELTNIEIFDTIFYLFEKVSELEALENDLKDLFICIELTEDENAEKRLASMETYLIRLSRALK